MQGTVDPLPTMILNTNRNIICDPRHQLRWPYVAARGRPSVPDKLSFPADSLEALVESRFQLAPSGMSLGSISAQGSSQSVKQTGTA